MSKITVQSIQAALDAPEESAALLATILNNRGYRDATIVMIARSQQWGVLHRAAVAGLCHAMLNPPQSVWGPATVLGIASWIACPQNEAHTALWREVPDSDNAYRMASLALQVSGNGIPASEWAARIATATIDSCMDFAAAG